MNRAAASFALVLAACGGGADPAGGASSSSTATATDAFVACPGAQDPGPTGIAGDELVREGTAGYTDVTALYCNPLLADPPGDELTFYIVLSDHFGIPKSNLALSWSRSNLGRTEGPYTWDGDDLSYEDHHAQGLLRGPALTPDGISVVGVGSTHLELHLAGIGAGEAVFEWDQSVLH